MSDLSPFIEELRQRLTLSDLIRPHVPSLKRHGREFKGLCPFHQEKGASFTVNDDKRFFHCFGCGAHGDHVGFLMKKQGLAFMDAVEILASQAGLTVPHFTKQQHDESPVIKEERASITQQYYKVMELASRWFETQLRSPQGRPVRDYLAKRGISEQSIKTFRLGYAPEKGLKEALMADGFSEDILVAMGLLIRPEDGGRAPYERFRDRLMFAIQDSQGRPIAFGGRIMGAGDPKYLNSPETPIFHKGRQLYALNHCQASVNAQTPYVVCEGYMDVIALHQAGFTTAVAPLGTALTLDQVGLLWRRSPVPLLCFDGDTAGRRAAARSSQRVLEILKPGNSLSFCFLPDGEDPDSLLQKGERETVRKVLQHPTSLVDMLWHQFLSGRTFDTPELKSIARKDVWTLCQEIKDPEISHLYREDLMARLNQLLQANQRNYRVNTNQQSTQGLLTVVKSNRIVLAQKILLATVVTHPLLMMDVAEELMSLDLFSQDFVFFRQEVLDILNDHPYISNRDLVDKLQKGGFAAQLKAILDTQVFHHARFAHPSASIEEAKEGWMEVWSRIVSNQQLKDETQQAALEAKSTLDPAAWERLKRLKTTTVMNY